MKNKQEAIFALIGAIFFALLFAIFLIGGIINILVPVIKITLIQIINKQYNLFDNSIILGLYGGCYFIFVCWIIGLCILGRYYFIFFKRFHDSTFNSSYNDKEIIKKVKQEIDKPEIKEEIIEEKEIPISKYSISDKQKKDANKRVVAKLSRDVLETIDKSGKVYWRDK